MFVGLWLVGELRVICAACLIWFSLYKYIIIINIYINTLASNFF